MGVRKDLDRVAKRYVYYLMHNDKVIYVGTAINPLQRLKAHVRKIKNCNSAPIYVYCVENDIIPTLSIVAKLRGTYRDAETIEIEVGS